ncbi:MAG TPA: hypothetical protein V6C89_15165 [Drouetiella sp.]
MNTVIEAVKSSTFDSELKAKLVPLIVSASAAHEESVNAMNELISSKNSGMEERKYAIRFTTSYVPEERDQLLEQQLAKRNEYANLVFRAWSAQRILRKLCDEIRPLLFEARISVENNHFLETAVEAVSEFLEQCIRFGAGSPDKILGELDSVDGICGEKIKEAVRILFEQQLTGIGKYAAKNFSCQPVMFDETASLEQRELWCASRNAIDLFNRVRAACDVYRITRSQLNVPLFIDRLESAQLASDAAEFRRIQKEQRVAERNLLIAGGNLLQMMNGYQKQIDSFAQVIDAAAKSIPDTQSYVHLVEASSCLGAWHWLHEMRSQLDIALKRYNPRDLLTQITVNVEDSIFHDKPWRFVTDADLHAYK